MSGHEQQLDYQYLQELQEKLKQNPSDIQALITIGALMFEPFHQQEEAERYLKKAIKNDPGNTDARFWLAKVYYHEFIDDKKTKQVLEEALKIDPNRADCLSLMASVASDLGAKPEEYIKYLERAVKQEPNWVTTHAHLADALVKLEHFDDAEAEAQKALSVLGSVSVPSDSIGQYYESVVTGRTALRYTKERLEKLIQEIQKRKEGV